jgi:hypothetical protein
MAHEEAQQELAKDLEILAGQREPSGFECLMGFSFELYDLETIIATYERADMDAVNKEGMRKLRAMRDIGARPGVRGQAYGSSVYWRVD